MHMYAQAAPFTFGATPFGIYVLIATAMAVTAAVVAFLLYLTIRNRP